jgi:hypothetical protein
MTPAENEKENRLKKLFSLKNGGNLLCLVMDDCRLLKLSGNPDLSFECFLMATCLCHYFYPACLTCPFVIQAASPCSAGGELAMAGGSKPLSLNAFDY